jgi:hypothetical protein
MFRRASHAAMLGLGLLASQVSYANAQQQKDGRDVTYEAGRNRVGLQRYCKQKGLLEAAVANVAIRVTNDWLERLPASEEPIARRFGDYAQRDGEVGILGPESRREIEGFAAEFNTTPAAICREWAIEGLRGSKSREPQQAQRGNKGNAAPPPYAPQPAPKAVVVAPAPQPVRPAPATTAAVVKPVAPPIREAAPVRPLNPPVTAAAVVIGTAPARNAPPPAARAPEPIQVRATPIPAAVEPLPPATPIAATPRPAPESDFDPFGLNCGPSY